MSKYDIWPLWMSNCDIHAQFECQNKISNVKHAELQEHLLKYGRRCRTCWAMGTAVKCSEQDTEHAELWE